VTPPDFPDFPDFDQDELLFDTGLTGAEKQELDEQQLKTLSCSCWTLVGSTDLCNFCESKQK